MKFLSLYRVELRRLALSRFTWVIALLSLCAPLLGYSLYQPCYPTIMSARFIANPVLAGTTVGAILWAVLALLEIDRVHRTKTDVLIGAIASPVRMAAVRLAALVTLSTATCLLCMLVYLPYTIVKLDYLFRLDLYAISFLGLMLPTWCISILLATALYQIARRIELAGLLYAACVYFSFSRFASMDYFMRWINPLILAYSDGFSSLYYLRTAFYTRALWLALAGGVWMLSLLCIRRYEKNLLRSFLLGLKKVYLPITAVALLGAGILMWYGQPIVDHGPAEYKFYDHFTNSGGSSEVMYHLTAKPALGQLHGVAEYTSSAGGTGKKSIWLNPGYKILRITCDGQPVEFKTTSVIEVDAQRTDFMLTEKGWKTLTVEYQGFPAILRCFSPRGWGQEINNDYISLSNASSVPRLTGLGIGLLRAYTVELTIPGHMTPIVNHEILTDFTQNADGTKTWTKGRATDSPDWVWITACDYTIDSFDAAGMAVDFVYSTKYDKIMEEYNMQGSLAEVLTYCTERLGQLRWGLGRSLTMVQRSAINDGGNAGPGWVEWGESTFSTVNLSDPHKGANAAEVFVHEMVHLWWGGLGVYCGGEWEASDNNPWSDEGLTVYTTYRMMKDKYGADYAQQYYVDVWQAAVDIQERGFYYRHPEYLDRLPEQYRAQLNSQNRGINLYSRMPLMILKAEALVGGEEKMDEILRGVQQKYAGSGRHFTYGDFLVACGLSEGDLTLD